MSLFVFSHPRHSSPSHACSLLPPSGIWTHFQRVLVKKYANERNGVNILVGPIFDYDFDGVRDSTEKIREWENTFGIMCICCETDTEQPHECADHKSKLCGEIRINTAKRSKIITSAYHHRNASGMTPVPTHYFVVLTSCLDFRQPADMCTGPLSSAAFILPHRPSNAETCRVRTLMSSSNKQ